ncbi:MAG: hypothetical protein WC631_02260 [Candidatus Paceibacterota bacterium]|jgi:hypothetical protein
MNFEAINQMAKGRKSPEKSQRPEKTQEELRQALSERMENIRLYALEQIDIYEDMLEKGDFDDKEGEPEGSGEKRKLEMQKDLLRADKQIDKIKEMLSSDKDLPQESVPDITSLNSQNKAILEGLFGKPEKGFVPTLIKPEDQDYTALKDDTDTDKFGEYMLNPDMQNIDFENIQESKIFIPDLSSFVGRPLCDVFKHLADTYSGTHHIPGLEYWKWLTENPTKTPPSLKDTDVWFYFPGSLVRSSGGDWFVPSARWDGSGWLRSADWLGDSWLAAYRVVLLEI